MEYGNEEYQEKLGKEKRRRNIRIIRNSLGMSLMIIFAIWLYFFGPEEMYRMPLFAASVVIILYYIYKLSQELQVFYSLVDELHFEDGELVKYNPRLHKTQNWIPIESIEDVYFNVEDKPNLLYVVYSEDGDKKAESFYKQRIKDEEKVRKALEKRSLIVEEPIAFEELKEKVEGG